MKKFSLVFLTVVVLFLSACESSDQIKPLKEEVIEFDMNTANEMIEKKEKMIIDVALKEKISRAEYKELEKSLSEEFGDWGRDILSILIINDLDSDPESDIEISKNVLYPTVFHKGVSITNAEIYKSYYENEFFNQTQLSIREEYVGDDEKLQDWRREYIFKPNENDDWELHGFSGVMNFSGEDFSIDYLELK